MMTAVFIRLIDQEEKGERLRTAVEALVAGRQHADVHAVDPSSFVDVPKAPFSYWVSDRVRMCFQTFEPLDHDGRVAKQGLATANDFRFVRTSWEVHPSEVAPKKARWFPFAKGGKFSPFYADVHLLVHWSESGREVYASGANKTNPQYYFRPGLTWPLRTQGGLSVRSMPAGCVFGHKGSGVFVPTDDPADLLTLLSVMNSAVARALIDLQTAFGSYEVGVLQRTPIPEPDAASRDALQTLARKAWSGKWALDTRDETSHAFVLPALLQVDGRSLTDRALTWRDRTAATKSALQSIARTIDGICFELYGIHEDDRQKIEAGFGKPSGDQEEAGDEEDQSDVEEVDAESMVASLVSWVLGTTFGRFDVRLVTGELDLSFEPEPFAPLHPCSAGMLTGIDGLPPDEIPQDYPIEVPRDGILVDDQGHFHDLVASAREVFQIVFGDDSDDRWQEAVAILDPRQRSLRKWLAGAFFEDHIKRYSKSRRKAPIYWQLATPTASYSAWLYYPRLTQDTFYRVLNDFLAPKLNHEERKLASLTQEAGPSPSVGKRKEVDALEQFVSELRAFHNEVARVAPLWNPNLDDGVVINFAPLWRLVPQHRAWQKECKATWNKLCEGDYDWAQLAMHLWPERVVPKCGEDRSLAIAHGLEDVFWFEDPDGKWQPRMPSQSDIDMLVRVRSSAAVKNALKSLLEAPTSATESATRRKSRRTKGTRKRTASTHLKAATNGSSPLERSAAFDAELLTKVKKAIGSNGKGAGKADIIDATGISASEWNKAIRYLLSEGSVTQTGERRGARYHLVGGDST